MCCMRGSAGSWEQAADGSERAEVRRLEEQHGHAVRQSGNSCDKVQG